MPASKRIVLAAVALAAVCVVHAEREHASHRVRIGTFNIEEFPKDDRQVAATFDLIASLDDEVLAVEEVFDADTFAAAARARLGSRWRFATIDGARGLGVLFDGDRYDLASVALHGETRILGRGKPALEVTLTPHGGGAPLRLLVVHLQSGSDARPFRAQQLAALDDLVATLRRTSGPIIVLGDFNATSDADRVDIAAIAHRDDLTWASEGLACTAFWRRAADCPTSRLDHVLTSMPVERIDVAGACADGCAARDTCPAYRDQVSDHCPVSLTIVP